MRLNIDVGRYLFVRPCYPKLLGFLDEARMSGTYQRFVIKGIPGIGKTTFLYYYLHVLIKQKKCVVFEDFKGLMFLVLPDGKIFEGKRGDSVFKKPLADRSAYYLFNCGGSAGTATPLLSSVHAATFAASSPSIDHTQELCKTEDHIVFTMPMWTLDELLSCRLKIHSPNSEAMVTESFRLRGGVARPAFYKGNADYLQMQLESALQKFAQNPAAILSSIVGGADPQSISHKLMHYKVEDDFIRYSTIIASDYIGDRMCDINLKAVVERIASLQTDKMGSALRGGLFERFAHRVLALGSHAFGAKKTLLMSPVNGDRKRRIPIPNCIGTNVDLHVRQICDLPICTTSNAGLYLIPEVPNFPVVDSLVLPRTGYQMTVSPTHDLEVGPLTELLEKLKCTEREKFRLVWVVPTDVEFKCRSIPDSISDRVEQYVLKLPLQVPLALVKTPLNDL